MKENQKGKKPNRKRSAEKWDSIDLVEQAKDVAEKICTGREFYREAAEGIKDRQRAVEEHREGSTGPHYRSSRIYVSCQSCVVYTHVCRK